MYFTLFYKKMALRVFRLRINRNTVNFFLLYLVVVRATILFVPQPSYLCVCQDVGRRPGISEENVFILARANVAIVVQDSTRRVQKHSGGGRSLGRGGGDI